MVRVLPPDTSWMEAAAVAIEPDAFCDRKVTVPDDPALNTQLPFMLRALAPTASTRIPGVPVPVWLTVPAPVSVRAPVLWTVTRPLAELEVMVPLLLTVNVSINTLPPTALTVAPLSIETLEPVPVALMVIPPAVLLKLPTRMATLVALGWMSTDVPLPLTVPPMLPAPTICIACPGLKTFNCPLMPLVDATESVPESEMLIEAAAALVMDIVPPVPLPGAVAVRLPVTPLLVTAAPITKGLVASL